MADDEPREDGADASALMPEPRSPGDPAAGPPSGSGAGDAGSEEDARTGGRDLRDDGYVPL